MKKCCDCGKPALRKFLANFYCKKCLCLLFNNTYQETPKDNETTATF